MKLEFTSDERNVIITAGCLGGAVFWFLGGCLGLGVGLLFLTVPQSIGVSMLSGFTGAFLGYKAAGRITKQQTLKEKAARDTAAQTGEPVAEDK